MELYESQKALNALLYVVSKLGRPGMHQAFKTIYFAEKKYMADFGMPILQDNYCKMDKGPVPSAIYDFVKVVRGDRDGSTLGPLEAEVKSSLQYQHPYLSATKQPDLDYLASTEIEYLDQSIDFCRNKGFGELKLLSHDAAWDSAIMNDKMDRIKIAEAGDASPEALEYLRESLHSDPNTI